MGNKGKRTKKKNKKNKNLKIIVTLILILLVICIYRNANDEQIESTSIEIKQTNFEEKFFENVETTTGEISEYTVYGTHFNIEGEIDLTDIADDITDIDLVLIDLEENETKVDTEYEIDIDTITFSTGDVINEGLYLEGLEETTYYLMLKVETIDEETTLYSLENNTDYGEIEYYTITKNNTNNKIVIDFSEYNNIPYLNFKVTRCLRITR